MCAYVKEYLYDIYLFDEKKRITERILRNDDGSNIIQCILSHV